MAKPMNGEPASAKAGERVLPLPPRRRAARRSPAAAGTPAAAATEGASSPAGRVEAPKRPRRPRKARAAAAEPEPVPAQRPPDPPPLSEEEQVLSAKYLPRELPRVFEEERFIFPESYGVNRVRLLVKDPYWLFAHWDVDPQVRAKLREEKGERVAALARLTLRLMDNASAGSSIVVPEGTRSWYLRALPGHRAYRVELGLTLPSGEYRPLAQSNAVSTPRLGPSPEKATRRASYRLAAKHPPAASLAAFTAGPGVSSDHTVEAGGPAGELAAGPDPALGAAEPAAAPEPATGPEAGGASDRFRR